MRIVGALLLSLLLASPARAIAQEHGATATPTVQQALENAGDLAAHPEANVDIITPHITDSHHMEIPYWKPPFYKEVHLPEWEPVQIGPVAIDLSPTKYVVMLLIAATLCIVLLVGAGQSHRRHQHQGGVPKGFAAGLEAVVLYIRNEVIMPNVGGRGGERYAPFLLTLFFFILFANLLGLIPYGATATGSISVTATLAIITFIVVEVAGMRALGPAYLGTIVYWPHDMPLVIKVPMTLIMTPIEIVGKITKPFALAIRLFANMTAGHIVVLALIGLIFTFANLASGVPFLMAVAIMMLELFVALLQAFIFTLLSSVFIGQIREAAH
jgi:F-type H+-transporting ATPase subunit a